MVQCCNPIEVANKSKYYESDYNIQKIYYDLLKHIEDPMDEYYIFLAVTEIYVVI